MHKQLTSDELKDIVEKLQIYLKDLQVRWDQQNTVSKSWLSLSKSSIFKCTAFILSVVDELIIFVEDNIPDGKDKKLAVISVVGKLFDYIAIQTFPLFLKPFSGTIKGVVVNIIVSELIDYIVSKYNSGYWTMKQEAKNGEKNQTT